MHVVVQWFKGTAHHKIKKYLFSLTFNGIYQSKLFCCALPSFGDVSCRDFRLLSNIMGLNGARNVVFTAPQKYINAQKS